VKWGEDATTAKISRSRCVKLVPKSFFRRLRKQLEALETSKNCGSTLLLLHHGFIYTAFLHIQGSILSSLQFICGSEGSVRNPREFQNGGFMPIHHNAASNMFHPHASSLALIPPFPPSPSNIFIQDRLAFPYPLQHIDLILSTSLQIPKYSIYHSRCPIIFVESLYLPPSASPRSRKRSHRSPFGFLNTFVDEHL